jgi:hypothetical protein
VLNLSSNPLHDSALQDLTGLRQLRELLLDETEMTGRSLTALQPLACLTLLSADNWRRLVCPLHPLASLTQLQSLSLCSDPSSEHRRPRPQSAGRAFAPAALVCTPPPTPNPPTPWSLQGCAGCRANCQPAPAFQEHAGPPLTEARAGPCA